MAQRQKGCATSPGCSEGCSATWAMWLTWLEGSKCICGWEYCIESLKRLIRRIITQTLMILEHSFTFCGREQLPIWKNSMMLIPNKNLVLITEHQVTVKHSCASWAECYQIHQVTGPGGDDRNAWHNRRGTFRIRLKSVQDTWVNYRGRWPRLVFPNSIVPVLQSTPMASSGVPYGNCQREKGLGPGSQKGQCNMLVPARGELLLKTDPEGK